MLSSGWTTVLIVCVILVFLIKRYFTKKSQFWVEHGFEKIGSETLGNPLINIIRPKSIREVDDITYKRIKHDLGKPFAGSVIFTLPSLMVVDLEMIKNIMVKDFDNFMNRPQLDTMKDTDPMFSKMLFFMESERWKELRSKMSPTFTTGKIKRMFEILNTSCSKMVEYLDLEIKKNQENQGELNILNPFGRYTMDVIASAAFGIDAKTFIEEDPIFTKMGKKLEIKLTFGLVCKALLIITIPKLAKALKLGMTDKGMEDFFTNVILSTIKHRETTGDKRDDFLQLMLEARNGQLKDDENDQKLFDNDLIKKESELSNNKSTKGKDKVILADDILVAQSILFILAGFDTTETLLIFALYELALHPEIQDKLADEVGKSWDQNGGKFTYESINQLEYLDKVTNEALRKYPPVTRLERVTLSDYKIPDTNLILPKGSFIVIPTYSIHHDEEYFPDPEKFDPERFTQENKNNRHSYAFQPFGHGPRNCIGMRFALTNSKMAIATLVHNFTFEPSAKTAIPVKFTSTNFLKPEGGLFLKLTKRNH